MFIIITGERSIGLEYPEEDASDAEFDNFDTKCETLLDSSGVDLDTGGSDQDEEVILFIMESMTKVNKDSSIKINPEMFKIKPEWNEKLEDFCKTMNVSFSKPSWRLVVYCGYSKYL